MNTKLQQIKIWKKRGLSLVEIGEKLHPPVSGERVRQIMNPQKYTKCSKHKALFLKECSYCKTEKQYKEKLNKMNTGNPFDFVKETRRLAKPDRKKETVIERALLIKFLKDVHKVPLSQIAHALSRDFTSVKGLYIKKI